MPLPEKQGAFPWAKLRGWAWATRSQLEPVWPHGNHQKASNWQYKTSSRVPWKSHEKSCVVRGPPEAINLPVSRIQHADACVQCFVVGAKLGWAGLLLAELTCQMPWVNHKTFPYIFRFLNTFQTWAPNPLRFWRKDSLNSPLRMALSPFSLG